jgi:hypothetical protein
MLLCHLAFASKDDVRAVVTYGTAIQMRNCATSLGLAAGPRTPSNPDTAWDYFAVFEQDHQDLFWNIGRVNVGWGSPAAVKCGSLIRLVSTADNATLSVANLWTTFSIIGQSEGSDDSSVWNVSCQGPEWKAKHPAQFKNVAYGCYLAARLNYRTDVVRGDRYPLECSTKSDANTLWVAERGLFPQDDLDDKVTYR